MATRLNLIFLHVLLASAATPDPCTNLMTQSRCEDGICVDLYWVDYEMTLFTFAVSVSMGRVLNEVKCSEAHQVLEQGTVANSVHLHHQLLLDLLSELGDLLGGLIDSLSRFPFDPFDQEPAIEQMRRLYRLIQRTEGSTLERTIALELIENSAGLVSSFFVLVSTKAYSVSLLPMRDDVSAIRAFAPYAAIATDLESVIHGIEPHFNIVNEIIHRFPPLYKQQTEMVHPSSSDLDHTELLQSIIDISDVIHSMVVVGHGNLSPPDLGMERLLNLVRSPNADQIHDRLCPNVVKIAEYSAALHAHDGSLSGGAVNALIGMMVSLCFEHVSVADRIRVSTLCRGPRTLTPFAQAEDTVMPDQSINQLPVGEGNSPLDMDEAFTTNGESRIRIPAKATGKELVDSLRDFVQSQTAVARVAGSRFDACICQYLKGISVLLYVWDFPDSWILNSQLLEIFKDMIDFASKVAISGLIGRKPGRDVRLGISQFPLEKMIQESMAFLLDPLTNPSSRR